MSNSNCCQGVDGPCDGEPKRRRQNTAYTNDSKNWVNMCDECFKHTQQHWDEMWSELRGSQL